MTYFIENVLHSRLKVQEKTALLGFSRAADARLIFTLSSEKAKNAIHVKYRVSRPNCIFHVLAGFPSDILLWRSLQRHEAIMRGKCYVYTYVHICARIVYSLTHTFAPVVYIYLPISLVAQPRRAAILPRRRSVPEICATGGTLSPRETIARDMGSILYV